MVKLHLQVTKWLVAVLSPTQPFTGNDPVDLFQVSLFDQFPDFSQTFGEIELHFSARFARVKGVFIQLKMFLHNSPVHHCAQCTVTDGKGLVPVGCRFVVPENCITYGFLILATNCKTDGYQKKKK